MSRAQGSSGGDQEELSSPGRSQLSATIRRKQQQVQRQIDELGMEALQERLESAAQTPANPAYRLSTLIQAGCHTDTCACMHALQSFCLSH